MAGLHMSLGTRALYESIKGKVKTFKLHLKVFVPNKFFGKTLRNIFKTFPFLSSMPARLFKKAFYSFEKSEIGSGRMFQQVSAKSFKGLLLPNCVFAFFCKRCQKVVLTVSVCLLTKNIQEVCLFDLSREC